MNADTFTNELRLMAPSSTDLAKWAMSSAGVDRMRNGYFASRTSSSGESDPLVDLCTNFDVSTLEIGMVTLCRLREFDQKHWHVGDFESDPIVLPKAGGKVAVRDHEDKQRQSCLCAKNSDSFLSAMLVAAKFFTSQSVSPSSEGDNKDAKQAFRECVSVAGGKEYEPFFHELLGV